LNNCNYIHYLSLTEYRLLNTEYRSTLSALRSTLLPSRCLTPVAWSLISHTRQLHTWNQAKFVSLIVKFGEMKQDSIIDTISRTIHRKDPSAEAFLFGSRARGDNRPDSDWDILILIDNLDITNEIEDKFRDDLYNLELESGQIISTFIYSKNYWENRLSFSPLFRNVKREGIRL